MHARHLALAVTASAAAALLGCGPPKVAPIVPEASSVTYVPIDNTPEDIAWCGNHPGGSPEWQVAPDGSRILVCRIVP